MLGKALALICLATLATACGSDHRTAAATATPPLAPPVPGASTPVPGVAPSAEKPAPPGQGASPTPVVLNGIRPGQEKATALDGNWKATTSGQTVKLYFFRGAAAINTPVLCTGTINATHQLVLTCADPAHPRTNGQAALTNDGTTLTITWPDGLKDVFTRA